MPSLIDYLRCVECGWQTLLNLEKPLPRHCPKCKAQPLYHIVTIKKNGNKSLTDITKPSHANVATPPKMTSLAYVKSHKR